ncbi:MAG: AAA family ATPase [Thermoplasmatota archaeon]
MNDASGTLGSGDNSFIDRVEEKRKLCSALHSAFDGKGGMMLIKGEAGIGKSRLIEECAVEADNRGFHLMFGKCLDYRKAPYMPFMEMLKDHFNIDPDKTYSENVRSIYRKIETEYPSIREHKKPLVDFFYKQDEPMGGYRVKSDDLERSVSLLERTGFKILVIGKEETIPGSLLGRENVESLILGGDSPGSLNPKRIEKIAKMIQNNLATYQHSSVIISSIEDLMDHNPSKKVDKLIRITTDLACSNNGVIIFGEKIPGGEELSDLKDLSEHFIDLEIKKNGRDAVNGKDDQPVLSLFDVIFNMFQEIAGGFPLLLIIEDLHWGDMATYNLLQYLARKAREEPLMLLGSYREEEAGLNDSELRSTTLKDTLQRLSREHLFDTIHLDRFDRSAVSKMVRSVTGEEPSPDRLEKIFRETEGNPLFIIELLNILDLEKANAPVMTEERPMSAATLVGRRLNSLDPEARRVLEQTAVFGERITLDLLSRSMDRDPEELLDILDQLISLKFLKETDEFFIFEHQKVRESIYELITKGRRDELHRRCAMILEMNEQADTIQDLSILAHHYMEAGDPRRSLEYLLKISESDSAKISYEDTIYQLVKGLASLEALPNERETEELHIRALQRLGDLYEETGELKKSMESYRKSIEISESSGINTHLPTSFRKIGDMMLKMFRWEQTIDYYLRSLHLSKKSEDAFEVARAFNGLGRMYFLKGDYGRAMECLMKYLEYPDHKKGASYTQGLISMGDIYFEMGDFNQALMYYKVAVRTAEVKEQDAEIAMSYVKTADVLMKLGEVADSRRFGEWGYNLANDRGRTGIFRNVLILYSELMADLGDVQSARKAMDLVRLEDDEDYTDMMMFGEYHRVQGKLYSIERNFSRSSEHFSKAVEIFKKIKVPYSLALTYFQYGLSRFQNMDVSGAIDLLNLSNSNFKTIRAIYYQNLTTTKLREVTFIREGLKS